MASNETDADVRSVLYACPLAEMCNGSGLIVLNNNRIADSIFAAHKREIAAKDEQYIKCREELAATRERRDECEVKMHKAFERVTKAEQEIAAKDAEIAELRERLKNAEEFAAEMRDKSTNSLVRACGHQMILRLSRKE